MCYFFLHDWVNGPPKMRERYGCVWKIAWKWATHIMHLDNSMEISYIYNAYNIYFIQADVFFLQFLFCIKITIHLWSVKQTNTENIHMPVYGFFFLVFLKRSLFRICSVIIVKIIIFCCCLISIFFLKMLIAPCRSLTSCTFIENPFIVTSPDDVFKQKYIYVNDINMCKRILRDLEINNNI